MTTFAFIDSVFFLYIRHWPTPGKVRGQECKNMTFCKICSPVSNNETFHAAIPCSTYSSLSSVIMTVSLGYIYVSSGQILNNCNLFV